MDVTTKGDATVGCVHYRSADLEHIAKVIQVQIPARTLNGK